MTVLLLVYDSVLLLISLSCLLCVVCACACVRVHVCVRRTLADVDRDGQLRADEFILAMHLVDTAKTGHPLPLSLPQDLVPPSLR